MGTEDGFSPEKWRFRGGGGLLVKSEAITVRGVLNKLMQNLDPNEPRPKIPLGHGDPSVFPCYRTAPEAEKAVSNALYSAQFNGYPPTVGFLPAKKAIGEHLSRDLPYELSPDDVYLTIGCIQAIEVILTVLARPTANILLPRPGFSYCESRAIFSDMEIRNFDLLPEKDWEVNLDTVESLADENTVAMAIINPGNPCGNVYRYEHLKEIAETARKLGILVISDEVYYHLAFGKNPFIPMGVFASIAPVITLGSISKRWMVPGWRLGWLVTNDPNGILKKHGVVDSIIGFLNISPDPPTFVQGAVVEILEKTPEEFFLKIRNTLREVAETCCSAIKDIACFNLPSRPEGAMYAMVRLNLSLLEDIEDDLDFCLKLSKEESVIVLPGRAVGLKNWVRITYSIDPSALKDGLNRIKVFCERHSKKQ